MHDILSDCLHELFILSHLLHGLPNTLQHEQVRELGTQLQELLQIGVLCRFLANASLMEEAEEVLCLQNVECLLLTLGFDILLVDYWLKELSCRQVVLQ